MKLDKIREEIDRLDREIVRLLDARASAGRQAAEAKQALGLPLRHPEREMQVLARLADLSDGSMPRQGLENIYRAIMAETLAQEGRCAESARPKQDIPAEVVENVQVAPGFMRMRLSAPALAGAFLPGQFFQLRVMASGMEPFLRRPFAPAENTSDGLAFVYAVVGEGTSLMATLQPGARVGLLAPLGNAYALPEPGARALLVGGGCGAPSLTPLAERLREMDVHVTMVLAARSVDMLLERGRLETIADRLIVSTDDGSCGCRGTAIDAIKQQIPSTVPEFDQVYSCGPIPLLRAVARLATEHGVPCQVSLEERMACGFGACMGCAVPVLEPDGKTSKYRRVCHEGPVFPAEMLAWNEI